MGFHFSSYRVQPLLFWSGECGRPMEKAVCHCGKEIGGEDHKEVESAKKQENYQAKAPKGYVLTGTEIEQKSTETFREMHVITVRILRLFLHLTLLIHYSTPKPTLDKLLNREDIKDRGLFLSKQVKADFDLLQRLTSLNPEDLCVFLHVVINQLMTVFYQMKNLKQMIWRLVMNVVKES